MTNLNSVLLNAVGDVTLGDHPVCLGHGVRSQIDQRSFDYLFQLIQPVLSGCDILFGNLETLLSDHDYDPTSLVHSEFRGKPEYAQALSKTGFSIMSVANNHAMQYGPDSYKESVSALKAANINPLGVAEDIGGKARSNCIYYSKDKIRIALIGYSLRPDNYTQGKLLYATAPESDILDHINSIKHDCNAVIVSLHWGEEYLHSPSPKQVVLAHRMIDNGANLILGHHPHVVQGVERYKNGYIAYSLGNFIADFWQEYTRKSMILQCRIGEDGIEQVEILPVFINKIFQPTLPQGDRKREMLAEFAQYAAKIALPRTDLLQKETESYMRDAERVYFNYRKECYRYFLLNLFRYRPSIILQSLQRFLGRRLGKN